MRQRIRAFRWNEVQFIAVGDYKNQVSLHGIIFVTFRIPEKLSEIRKLYSVYIFFLFHICHSVFVFFYFGLLNF